MSAHASDAVPQNNHVASSTDGRMSLVGLYFEQREPSNNLISRLKEDIASESDAFGRWLVQEFDRHVRGDSASGRHDQPDLGFITENSVRVQAGDHLGSGAITHLGDKTVILSDYHVVEGYGKGDTVTIRSDATGQSYQARIIGLMPGSDLAEIEVPDALKGLPGFELGDPAQAGDQIYMVGHAGGERYPVITSGIAGDTTTAGAQPISGSHDDPGTQLQNVVGWLAQGMSGGETLDRYGKLIGLNDATTPLVLLVSDEGLVYEAGRNSFITPVSQIERTLGGTGGDFRLA